MPSRSTGRWVPLPRLTPARSPPKTCASWRPATPRRSAPTPSITSAFRIVPRRSSRTPSPAPRGRWSSRSAGLCRTSPTRLAAATTSTTVPLTPCARPGSTPRAPPSPERPVPRPIPTASRGAWSWTGDAIGSKLRCNDGDSDSDAAYRGRWKGDELPNRPTVSVVICAYTEDRWPQLKEAVASVEAQTSPPIEIIVCIDHNKALLRKSEEYFGKGRPAGAIPLIVLANKYNGRLGSARNTAAEFASGEVLAFPDDDAAAAADWLERLIVPYDDGRVGAVGGKPLPAFELGRPRWFPYEFDWVFGC